jgi:hypothetical protein
MSQPLVLEGLKQIKAFVEEVTGLTTSISTMSRAISEDRPDRLPASFTHRGRVFADPDAVRAWALTPGHRRHKRRRR